MSQSEIMTPLLLWARNNLFISVPISILTFFALREYFFQITKKNNRLFNIILFPGIVIHELSHALGCILTGCKIVDIDLFTHSGGRVTYATKKHRLAKNFIISIFPLITGIILLYLLLNSFAITGNYFGAYIQKALFFYFAITIMTTMFPSRKDFANAFSVFIFVILLSLSLAYFFRNNIIFAEDIISFILYCIALLILAIFVIITAEKIAETKLQKNK